MSPGSGRSVEMSVRRAVDQGDAYAKPGWASCTFKAWALAGGAEGLRWMRMAGRSGKTPRSQNMLGLMYRHGQGVAKDEAEALSGSAGQPKDFGGGDHGDCQRAKHAGRHVRKGPGRKRRTMPSGEGGYAKAAEQGHALRAIQLGVAYGTGQGVAME